MSVVVCGSISKSPTSLGRAMHEAGYRALGLDWVYVPFRCIDVQGAVAGMRALSVRGLGVSMPFKIDIMPHLDALSDEARAIGAVNTVVNEDGVLVGHNTDAFGATQALLEVTHLQGQKVRVLGSSGAARAIVTGLRSAGADVEVCARNEAAAKALSNAVVRWEHRSDLTGVDIVVNATSIGMQGETPGLPLDATALHHQLIVFDAVYKPLDTELVREARRRGCRVVSGERMLLHQALAQFELYTGSKAPKEAMEQALLRAISLTRARGRRTCLGARARYGRRFLLRFETC